MFLIIRFRIRFQNIVYVWILDFPRRVLTGLVYKVCCFPTSFAPFKFLSNVPFCEAPVFPENEEDRRAGFGETDNLCVREGEGGLSNDLLLARSGLLALSLQLFTKNEVDRRVWFRVTGDFCVREGDGGLLSKDLLLAISGLLALPVLPEGDRALLSKDLLLARSGLLELSLKLFPENEEDRRVWPRETGEADGGLLSNDLLLAKLAVSVEVGTAGFLECCLETSLIVDEAVGLR